MIANMKICRSFRMIKLSSQLSYSRYSNYKLQSLTSYSRKYFRITKTDPHKKSEERSGSKTLESSSNPATDSEIKDNHENNIEEDENFKKMYENKESFGYLPPRELEFDNKGELVLFSMKLDVIKNKRKRQRIFIVGTAVFGYLVLNNLVLFNFQTAGILAYAKIFAYWLFGLTPSVYFLLVSQRAAGRILTEMRLKQNGEEVIFKNLRGEEFTKKITDLQPLMDERMLSLISNPSYKTVFYHFHSDGNHHMIDGLPKTNENIDIIQNIIHGIKIIVNQ